MPNKYEREIEEILRNLEQTEPKQGLAQRLGGRRKPAAPSPRPRARRSFSLRLTPVEWFLYSAIACALFAGGYAYISGTTIASGVIAIVGFVCLVLVALSYFIFRPRRPRPTQYGNVTITPIRRDPLSTLRARWNLFTMRRRYRRKDDQR